MLNTQLQVPLAVPSVILACRAKFREMNANAQIQNELRRAENPGGTHVDIGFVTKPSVLTDELQFWGITDDSILEDFLFDDLLAAMYADEDLDWESLPKGYFPLIEVLEFERHCQFEGWTAVSNKGQDQMRSIVASYRLIGLVDEAKALSAVADAYINLPDDDVEQFHELLGHAYRSVPNATPDIEDRIPHILAYVRSNAELFGAPI